MIGNWSKLWARKLHQTNQGSSSCFSQSMLSNLRSTCYSLTPICTPQTRCYPPASSQSVFKIPLRPIPTPVPQLCTSLLPGANSPSSAKVLQFLATAPNCLHTHLQSINPPYSVFYLLLLPKTPETKLTSILHKVLENNI